MFHFIDTCIVILILASNSNGMRKSSDGLFNVGTVLFTSDDLYKKRWSKTNIEVLQARRYFQNIFPSPSVDFLNENYTTNLLKYFTNAFSTLKREALDPGVTRIMELALTDAVGGYMKVWVLPITKLCYYGGIVTQEHAVAVFKYYETLKQNLKTDGSGWHRPTDVILKTMAVEVVPLSHLQRTRSTKYNCEHLAFFETSDAGLSIPIPFINWNNTPHLMFLPLKNESFILLDSPTASQTLMKYYDIAESCCHEWSKDPNACSEFDARFEDWVYNNVVPHVSDEKLYIAFGSLLRLLHKTDEYIQKASNLFQSDTSKFKTLLSKLPPCMTSKKFLVLNLILIVEIFWCVPALIYVICSRRKPKHTVRTRTKYFFDVFKSHMNHPARRTDVIESRTNFTNIKDVHYVNQIYQPRVDYDAKLIQKAEERNREILTQCPSHCYKRSAGQVTSIVINKEQECQCTSLTLINEKIIADARHSSHVKLGVLPKSKDITNIKQIESVTKIHKLESKITKIITDKNDSSKSCVTRSSVAAIKKAESKLRENLQDLQGEDKMKNSCPYIRCSEKKQMEMKANKLAEIVESEPSKARDVLGCVGKGKYSITKRKNVTNIKNKATLQELQPKVRLPKDTRLNAKDLTLNSNEPVLEIRIDRPAAEITVDITETCQKNSKPSKIPILTSAANAKGGNSLDTSPGTAKFNIRIPQVPKTGKKRSVDDYDTKRNDVKHKKLNVTL